MFGSRRVFVILLALVLGITMIPAVGFAEKVTTRERGADPTYTNLNESTHTPVYNLYEYNLENGEYKSGKPTGKTEKGEPEAHDFNSKGVCKKCKYEKKQDSGKDSGSEKPSGGSDSKPTPTPIETKDKEQAVDLVPSTDTNKDKDGKTEDGKTEDGKTEDGKTEDGKTEDGKTEDGKTEDGKTEDGKTEDGKTEDGKTEDGKTEDGKTEDGKTEDGKTEDGKTEDEKTEDEKKDDDKSVTPSETLSPREQSVLASEKRANLQEVPSDVSVHGIMVADNVGIVNALSTIGVTLKNNNAKVTVSGVSKVLSSSEMARYNALEADERLIVGLAALGLGDIAMDASAADSNLLSPEAVELAGEVSDRVSKMSAEELKALLGDDVAFGKILVDGVEYESMSIELTVEENGILTVERYTFRNENGKWILTMIEKA